MNLDGVLRAASDEKPLADFSWMEKSGLARRDEPFLDLEAIKTPDNIKPEIIEEWGRGPDFEDKDLSAGDVKRKPRVDEQNPKKVIHFARRLMNRGTPFSKVIDRLASTFAKVELRAAESGIRKLAKYDGIIGRVLVDAHGYGGNCHAAMADAAKSPWKSCLAYIAGCNCGDHRHVEEASVNAQAEEDGLGIDGFISETKRTASRKTVRCASTSLRIASWDREGFSDEITESTFLKLSSLGFLPDEEAARIKASNTTNASKIREAFRYIDHMLENNENAKFVTDVSPEEYAVDKGDTPVELCKDTTPVILIFDDVRPEGFETAGDIEVDEAHETPAAVEVDMKPEEEEIAVQKAENAVEVDMKPEEEEIELSNAGTGIEVDMGAKFDEVFKDCDIIVIEKVCKPRADAEVNVEAEAVPFEI